jgi:hypothetical protein
MESNQDTNSDQNKKDLQEGLKFLKELREMPLDFSKAGKVFVQSAPKKMIDQQSIMDRFRAKQKTSPEFQQKVKDLFKKPKIFIQPSSKPLDSNLHLEIKTNKDLQNGDDIL